MTNNIRTMDKLRKEWLTPADWREIETIRDKVRAAKGDSWIRYSDQCGILSAKMAIRIYLARINRTPLACWNL